jgi:uncharacterized membrane protein
MTTLFLAAVTFLAIHFIVAGTRLRDAIVAAIGERAYLGLFSVASVISIVWLAVAYNAAQAGGEDTQLYDLGPGMRHLGIPVIGLAFLLGVQGLMMPNPTAVMQDGAVGKADTIHGVLRITRHPFLWGVAIWSAFHLSANGDLASVVLFGMFLITALLGTVSIDAKRKRKLGAAWDDFANRTSNIPFAAAIGGRTPLKIGESFGWRFWVALVLFVAMLLAHAHVFGVSPFPGGWVPI